ncbi:cell division protein FtsX [Spongiibacter sp. KMU-158]|uniref:Cell division protein FtsX n=1 Tax=Spongiibacter pelagi TaxID=2760804 RepID=A0A927C1B4_9GAMM|nr:permease-like cell division protein FtsX [Spongiibacter pelagi]MBD2857831.1 cell division protein FtsX [Spongiibacter pelagi]
MSARKKNRQGAERRFSKLQAGTTERRRPAGAKQHRTDLRDRWESYRSHHGQVAADALKRLFKQPLATLMTSLVLAIAMALPMGLYVMLNNIEAVSQGWDGAARLSLYLKSDINDRAAQQLQSELKRRAEVLEARYISSEQALLEFREQSGLGDVLDQLDRNPLPALIVITPKPAYSSQQKVDALRLELEKLPQVDQLRLDMAWLQKLNQITEVSRRLAGVLAAMLAMGVLLIVGNTIKLAIESRRDEILVVKLVGGTNAFVRRPFLYSGFWFGLIGAVLAWSLLQACLIWLSGPVAGLSALYGSQFELLGLGFGNSILLILAGAGLGLLGALLVVGRELAAIEPR